MKITTGIDIIEVNRIKKSIDEYGMSFIHRIYTQNEIEYCSNSKINQYERYAARFAAKEAIYKALKIEEEIDIEWKDIEILKTKNGRPYVKLNNNLEKYMRKIDDIDVSLSHIKEMATANAVINWK